MARLMMNCLGVELENPLHLSLKLRTEILASVSEVFKPDLLAIVLLDVHNHLGYLLIDGVAF